MAYIALWGVAISLDCGKKNYAAKEQLPNIAMPPIKWDATVVLFSGSRAINKAYFNRYWSQKNLT
jgi:hypothetical protein